VGTPDAAGVLHTVVLFDEDENILQVAPPGEGENNMNMNNQQPQVQQGVGENNQNAVQPMDKQAVESTVANTLKKQHVKKLRITLKPQRCPFNLRASEGVGTHQHRKRIPPGLGKWGNSVPAETTVKKLSKISAVRAWHAEWPQLHDVGGDHKRWERLLPGYIGGYKLTPSCKRVWVDPVLAARDRKSAYVWCRVWNDYMEYPPNSANCGWNDAAWMQGYVAVRDTEFKGKRNPFAAIKVFNEEKNKYVSLKTWVVWENVRLEEMVQEVSLDSDEENEKGSGPDKSKFDFLEI
jgi:hypothetical protein